MLSSPLQLSSPSRPGSPLPTPSGRRINDLDSSENDSSSGGGGSGGGGFGNGGFGNGGFGNGGFGNGFGNGFGGGFGGGSNRTTQQREEKRRKSEKIERNARGQSVPFVRKNKEGTEFEDLCTLEEYWVVVHEDEKQAKIAADKYAASLACEGIAKNEGKRKVGCSCIEGNPCTEGNKYNCKNWEMRFAIAKENGWNGQ